MPYGPIERVTYCSENSAIIVFKLIRSACAASAAASKQLTQYELYVIWLPEYLQVPIRRKFSLQ